MKVHYLELSLETEADVRLFYEIWNSDEEDDIGRLILFLIIHGVVVSVDEDHPARLRVPATRQLLEENFDGCSEFVSNVGWNVDLQTALDILAKDGQFNVEIPSTLTQDWEVH